jgi:hypothetical protein
VRAVRAAVGAAARVPLRAAAVAHAVCEAAQAVLVVARRRRERPNRCRLVGVSRALSCARRSCTFGGCPRLITRESQRRCRPLSRCDPSRKPGLTLLRASRSGAEGLPGDEWRWDPSAAPACRSGAAETTPVKARTGAHRCPSARKARSRTQVLQPPSARPRASRH